MGKGQVSLGPAEQERFDVGWVEEWSTDRQCIWTIKHSTPPYWLLTSGEPLVIALVVIVVSVVISILPYSYTSLARKSKKQKPSRVIVHDTHYTPPPTVKMYPIPLIVATDEAFLPPIPARANSHAAITVHPALVFRPSDLAPQTRRDETHELFPLSF